MGKRHFKGSNGSFEKKRRKERAENWKNTRGDTNPNNGYTVDLSNERLSAFYSAQNFVAEGNDWDKFLESLRTPLPACFRINSDYAFAKNMQEQLMEYVGEEIDIDGQIIHPVEQLAWYPDGLGYKLGTDRKSIRKQEALKALHKWMVQNTENGNITRQEAVSMVPPLALNVEPHHKCLDMCAAPGSKTSQLLEVVHRSLQGPQEQHGLVVANDSDTDRAYMLVHQCKRLNSPLLVVTTHKGQMFPTISSTITDTPSMGHELFFDRVLCDVPCSGDGTLRKNPSIWTKWCTASGTTLHPLQLLIAQRGLQLLRPGGMLVYSTCSMSPFENEAVVAELLRSAKGHNLELVDARTEYLPKFKARKGLQTWYVLDDTPAVQAAKDARYREKQLARKEKLAERWAKKQQEGGNAEDTAENGADDDGDEEEGDNAPDNDGDDEDAAMAAQNAGDDNSAAIAMTTSNGGEDASKPDGTAIGDSSVIENDLEDFYKMQRSLNVTDQKLQACLDMGMHYFPTSDSVPRRWRTRIRSTLFPPAAEELKWMHLEKCLRCVPQDEDTGGFFVATLRKKTEAEMQSVSSSSIPSSVSATVIPSVTANKTAAEDEVTKPAADISSSSLPVASAEKCIESAHAATASSSDAAGKVPIPQKGLVDFHQWDTSAYEKMKEFYGFNEVDIPAESLFIREDYAQKAQMQNRQKQQGGGQGSGASKSIYFLPYPTRKLMQNDKNQQLKVVTAGTKIFERKGGLSSTMNSAGEVRPEHEQYRLLQDGIEYFAPRISNRKVEVSIQDFCNMLEGGLVSYNTFTAATLNALNNTTVGVVVCYYRYQSKDVLPPATAAASDTKEGNTASTTSKADANSVNNTANTEEGAKESSDDHVFYLVAWKSQSRVLNVMCSKLDMQSIKLRLTALNVLRPKVGINQGVTANSSAVPEASTTTTTDTTETSVPVAACAAPANETTSMTEESNTL